MEVVLRLTESLHDLGVDVVLGASLRRVVELLSLVSISVLLALPHVGDFLGGDLKDGWVKGFDDGVACGG